MKFIKNLFRKKEEPIRSYDEFWAWFCKHQETFHKVLKEKGNIERDFLNKLSPKLSDLKEGFWFLVGMYDQDTAELVITADGSIRNIVFVEELIGAAPKTEGWKFTALKPALDIENVSIEMGGYKFSSDNLSFYAIYDAEYPDEIDITIVHDDWTEENDTAITNGVHIFLDNYLGEMDFAVTIDNLDVTSKDKAELELIPIAKLKEYLKWRQKEFIEKYEFSSHDIEKDNYSILEAKPESGNSLIAVINTDLLEWDCKASHPWILTVEIPYEGAGNNGLPGKKDHALLDEIEKCITDELRDLDGYLNIGRQSSKNVREIYFACKEFRKPSKVLFKVQTDYSERVQITYEIYKDKYWRSFNRFNRVR